MAKNNAEKLSIGQLRKIWSKLTTANWLALLQTYRPDNHWVQRGDEIVGCCIYHSETTPSFHINPTKGFAYCFGGNCQKYVCDPIRLVADIMGTSQPQAIRHLKGQYGITISTTLAQNINKLDENVRLKEVLLQVMNLELRDALLCPDDPAFVYIAESGLIDWLRKRRLPEGAVHQWPVGVLPTRERLYQRLGEDIPNGEFLREAAYNYLKTYLALPGNPHIGEGSIVFFYYTSPTSIGRIKIRKPNTHTYYILDDPLDETVGFFGLNMFPELRPRFSEIPVYVTEGDFDVLATLAYQLENGDNDVFIVGTGGAMEDAVDQLTEFGFREIYLIPDNDEGGVGFVKNILRNNKKVTKIFTWSDEDTARAVKDIDDAFRAYSYDFYKRLRGINPDGTENDAYKRNHAWVNLQLANELEKTDDSDIRTRFDKIIDYGRILREESERAVFLEHICTEYGFDRDTVLQELAIDDTPEGFTAKILKKLKEEYYFLARQENANILAWCNRTRVMEVFPMNSAATLKAMLETDLGQLEAYVKTHIGEPEFLLYKSGAKGKEIPRSPIEKTQLVWYHFNQALIHATSNLMPQSKLINVGQGIHYFSDDNEEDSVVFIVNGDKIFRGDIRGKQITYSELKCPVSGKYLFRIENQPWSKNLESVADIEAGKQYNPRNVYKTIRHILDIGWRFLHHDLEATFLAADMMYTALPAIFQIMVFVDITGDTHTGKSTLMQLIGGDAYAKYRICEATALIDNFSSAGIRIFMSNNRLRLILDEFEDNDMGTGRPTRKATAVREILDLIRTAGRGTGSTWVRGTSKGGVTDIGKLNFPITVGGIYTMQEARDLNRFVHIKTVRIEGFKNPLFAIQQAYSPQQMRELRRQVTLCLLPRIPELLEVYEEVVKEFSDNSSLPPGIMSRQIENFLPAAAILKYIGEDYVSFVTEFSNLKLQELIAEGGNTTEAARIWNAILHTNVFLSQHDKEKVGMSSVARIIADADCAHILNTSDLGVYFLPKQKWLVVFWYKAILGILRYSNEYKNIQHYHRLKAIAETDPRVVPRETLERSNFLKREVWPRTGTKVSLEEISVLDLADTLADEEPLEPVMKDELERQRIVDGIVAELGTPRKRGGDFNV